MRQIYISLCVLFFSSLTVSAQISYNANDPAHVAPYTTDFLYGSNMGFYNTWLNTGIADIAAGNPARNVKGAGIKTLHLPLPEDFLDPAGPGHYDYDVEVWQFQHFATLGIKDNTVFLETPLDAHRDNTIYPGCSEQSLIWSNIYLPIWDGGANGTPYNDDNYLARYIYKTVTLYKPWVKFWELVNEPDFDDAGVGYRNPGDPAGNWWDRNPQPCELHNLKAPLYSYIRMMHIAYEVIKTVDPTAYVGMGGVGYPSFLDAFLRNTENPVDGSVTAEYPDKGGAWMDCLSFHFYPMYELHYFDLVTTNPGQWRDKRHSDAAIDVFLNRKRLLDSVLTARGYDGITYPKKVFINTENNVARVPVTIADGSGSTFIGGDEVQRNYDMKALVEAQLHDIKQYYTFSIGDSKSDGDFTDNPFDFVGLYKNLNNIGPGYDPNNPGPYLQQYNQSGIAYKTMSDALSGFSADLNKTAQMGLPAGVRGGAFKNAIGDYAYVLWAVTATDNTELASAVYSFPPAFSMPPLVYQRSWDYSQTNTAPLIAPQNIALTGAPVIIFSPLVVTALTPDSIRNNPAAYFSFAVYPNPATNRLTVKLHLKQKQAVSIKIMNSTGQQVMTIADHITYNAGDNIINASLSSKMAPGVYYCLMEAGGNRQQTIKLVITK